MNKFKGFTIIELLVVIAIIAVLAAIVMVNVTAYINKGKDVMAKGNLNNALTNAVVFYDDTSKGNGTYNGFVTGPGTGDPSYVTIYSGLTGNGFVAADIVSNCDTGAACVATATKWCMSVKLKQYATAQYFCVDSSGAKKQSTTSTCAAGVCPN